MALSQPKLGELVKKMKERPGLSTGVGVVALLSALTSPVAVAKLLVILSKTPLSIAHSFASYFAPSLFWKKVAGEVVVITGGAGGIGRLMALKMASLGATVVLLDKDEEGLKKTQVEVAAAATGGAKVFSIAVDLSDREATYAAMKSAQAQAGACTMLFNNAGIVTGKKLLEGKDFMQDLTMQVNATSHFWTVKSVLPNMMANNHGHIVTIASSAGMVGTPGLADYCASKAAAVRFDESIRLEMRSVGKRGVKTTVVCPFFIDTGMFDGVRAKYPLLLPVLKPEFVANKIISAVRCDQQVLLMPILLHLVTLLRGLLPIDICADLLDWFGILDTMDHFKGRK